MKRFLIVLLILGSMSCFVYADGLLILGHERGEFYLAAQPKIMRASRCTIIKPRIDFYWNDFSREMEYKLVKQTGEKDPEKVRQYHKTVYYLSFTFYNDGEVWYSVEKVFDMDEQGLILNGYSNFMDDAEKVVPDTEIGAISDYCRKLIEK